MICYQKTDGLAHDLRFVEDGYLAQPGEFLLEGDKLPAIDSLHDAEVLLISSCERAVQQHLDFAARSAGYDSIFSAVTYADEPSVPAFQQQGQALRAWRSAVWAKCYEVLGAVQAGAPAPTVEQLLAQLPAAPQI